MPGSYACPDCARTCRSASGLARHRNTVHRNFSPVSDDEPDPHKHTKAYHPKLTAIPCDRHGVNLPAGSPPLPAANLDEHIPGSWAPFDSRTEFDFAHFHFVQLQSSADEIHRALDLWTAAVLKHGERAPWRNAEELYNTIDEIQHGLMPWRV
ncbi:hypothetical protein B0H16DRAFT_1746857 [Mycena metata]|uniref:C2H2-type domain-containing protein n=1 Tax=Mycena metata TaxID=1033252 RepID=A0AAD7M976_9AGAR|nr:hypothetical protein B0H16DRAFT_1746857 [Mycena metata]